MRTFLAGSLTLASGVEIIQDSANSFDVVKAEVIKKVAEEDP